MPDAFNRVAEWLVDVRVSLQLGQDEVDKRTRDMGARVSQSYLSQLERGIKPEVVAKMVGHSSPVITLRIYRQVFQDELDETREMLAGLV